MKPEKPENWGEVKRDYAGTERRDDYTGWNVSTEVTCKAMKDNLKAL
jgi:hypothetical protein